MIEITFNPKKYEFKAIGHAEHGEHGKDIVCAAISTLFYTLCNTLEDSRHMLHKLDIDDTEGNAYVRCKPKKQYEGNVACTYRTILIGAEMVALQYPENVSFSVVKK